MTKYAGADWIARQGRELSPIGIVAADILGQVWRGIYHLDDAVLHKRVKWHDKNYIRVVIGHRDLSTYDFNKLTELVLIAHAMAVRVSVEPVSNGYFALSFSQRKRNGAMHERHHDIQQAIEACQPLIDAIK